MPYKNKIKRPVNKSIDELIKRKKKKYKKVKRNHKKRKINGISIVVVTNKLEYLNNIFDNYQRQNFKKKELVVVLNKNEIKLDDLIEKTKRYDNVQIFQLDEEKSVGECLNYAVSKCKFDVVAKFDDDDYYSSKYLLESVKYFEKTNASLIGKSVIYVYFEDSKILAVKKVGNENEYVKYVHGSTLIFRRSVFNKIKFKHLDIGEDRQFCRDCYDNGMKIYSTNRNYFVYIRHKSLDQHYWKISNEKLLKKCTVITKTDNYKIWE